MSDEWREVALGDLIEIVRGISYKSAEMVGLGEGVPFLNLKSVERGGGFRAEGVKAFSGTVKAGQVLAAGDLLIAVTDLTRGKELLGCPVVVPSDPRLTRATFSLDLARLVVTSPDVLTEYLGLFLQIPSTREFMKTHSSGTTVIHLKVKDVPRLRIPLPPLSVQRRIVDLMGHLDTHLANLETERKTVRRLLDALRDDLLAPVAELDDLAGRLAIVRAGGTPDRKTASFYGGEIPWLKSGEVSNAYIRETEESITQDGLHSSSAWLVPSGAVVVAMYGATAGQVGHLSIPLATNQAVLALVADPGESDGRFLYHWMSHRTPVLKAAATGAAQPNLSKQVVLRVAGFPSFPLARQRSIAGTLDSAEALGLRIEEETRKVANLRAVILSRLLTASTTLPESYDELLGVGL